MPALIAEILYRLLHTQRTQKVHDVLKLQHKHIQTFASREELVVM